MGERSFFVEPGIVHGERASLRGPVAHQIGRVLRLRAGDEIELLDNSGFLHIAKIAEISRDAVEAQVIERRRPETEPPVRVELYQALPKGQKMELVLQKGTETGVSRFVPVLSERCVSRPDAKDMASKLERWRAIVREAAEQSGRALLPEVAPLEQLRQACASASAADLAVMAWEEERGESLVGLVRAAHSHGDGYPASVALLIGPEGGFSEQEADIARASGVRTVGLGPRILRAETAAIVAVTVVLCETGGLGG